jgi:tetratricopeptide (TPR) repeat protein
LHQLLTEWLREDRPAAEAVLRRLIDIDAADGWARRELAVVLNDLGRHDEALDFMRELLDENQPRTPGVTTSVVVVLAALALLRGDSDTAGALLDYAGLAIIQSGIRTPVDMILYAHYLRRLGEVGGTRSQRDREQAEAMSPSESIALGLTPTSG